MAAFALPGIISEKLIWTVTLKFTRNKKAGRLGERMIAHPISHKKNMDALWKKKCKLSEI